MHHMSLRLVNANISNTSPKVAIPTARAITEVLNPPTVCPFIGFFYYLRSTHWVFPLVKQL